MLFSRFACAIPLYRNATIRYHKEDGSLFASNPRRIFPMTDAVKKTTKKATTKTKVPAKTSKKADGSNGLPSNVREIGVSYEQVAMLAHRYWIERGRRHGNHQEDWFRAEQELRGKAS
jgi:hypothetical protein